MLKDILNEWMDEIVAHPFISAIAFSIGWFANL